MGDDHDGRAAEKAEESALVRRLKTVGLVLTIGVAAVTIVATTLLVLDRMGIWPPRDCQVTGSVYHSDGDDKNEGISATISLFHYEPSGQSGNFKPSHAYKRDIATTNQAGEFTVPCTGVDGEDLPLGVAAMAAGWHRNAYSREVVEAAGHRVVNIPLAEATIRTLEMEVFAGPPVLADIGDIRLFEP